jgi:hypothetical protein
MSGDEEGVAVLGHGIDTATLRISGGRADFDQIRIERTGQTKRREASKREPENYSLMRAHTSNETQAQLRLRGAQVAASIGTLATLDIQENDAV